MGHLEYDAALLEARRAAVLARHVEVGDARRGCESGVQVENFGPVQATAFGDLPEVHILNQIQGAAEPGASRRISGAGGRMDAVAEVDYRVPVAEAGRAPRRRRLAQHPRL